MRWLGFTGEQVFDFGGDSHGREANNCQIETKDRTVHSVDGPIELTEAMVHCRRCRRSFFPQREALGFDPRESPACFLDPGHTPRTSLLFPRRVWRVDRSHALYGED